MLHLLKFQNFSKNIDSKQTLCVGGRHNSEKFDIIEYETINLQRQMVVKFRRGICDIC